MKITAIAATQNKFTLCDVEYQFTEDQLQKMADTSKDKMISKNFGGAEPIQGRALEARVEYGKLAVDIDLFVEAPGKILFCVPGYRDGFEIFGFALTETPADKSLEPIRVVQE